MSEPGNSRFYLYLVLNYYFVHNYLVINFDHSNFFDKLSIELSKFPKLTSQICMYINIHKYVIKSFFLIYGLKIIL